MTNNELAKELREGCKYKPRRWSGDTHDDDGGLVDEGATDALMLAAADIVERASELQRALFHAQNDVSIAKQKAAVLSELNKELRAKDSERDALKDALEIANRSADEQMRYKREAEAERDALKAKVVELEAENGEMFSRLEVLKEECKSLNEKRDYDYAAALMDAGEREATLNKYLMERDTLAAENAELKESIASLHKVFAEDNKAHVERAYTAEAENARLREAAQAVIERWESPAWKDAEPTAAVIYRLRDVLWPMEGEK